MRMRVAVLVFISVCVGIGQFYFVVIFVVLLTEETNSFQVLFFNTVHNVRNVMRGSSLCDGVAFT
jgi:hypothetical protein